MRIYGTINKYEPQDDGSIIISGIASSEAVDSDGEVITSDAMKAALPDYMKFANIREMHQAKAAGVALEAEVQADGNTWIKAHIVDAEAVKKVKSKTYKGFSIGGKVTLRDELDKSRITGVRLSEISLVDRPANPEAMISFGKVEISDESDETQATAGSEVKKGMHGVANLAMILKQILYLQEDNAGEANFEGDNSTMPEEIKAWLTQGGVLLRNMVAEETTELTGGTATDP
ncbi:MAG: XkdF-like putative serine protease domain-containing protein, partial [Pseudomonadota bacterium]